MNRNMNKGDLSVRSGLSRRDFLSRMGAGAAGLGLGSVLPWSLGSVAAAPVRQDAPATFGFYRLPVGELELTIIQDVRFPNTAANMAVNADAATLNTFLTENNYPANFNLSVSISLVRSGDSLALLDTGVGGPTALLPTLALLGIEPEAITHVLISHFHPDHIGGTTANGAPVFPNASYHFPQTEWDFLQNPPAAAADRTAAAIATLQPLADADQLAFYSDGDELITGVQAVAAPGHSTGHHAFLLASGGQQLLNLVDAAAHPLISLGNPDWHFTFDQDPAQAVATRRALLQRAVDEQMFLFGYHFPFPGVGVVDADGDGYRFSTFGF